MDFNEKDVKRFSVILSVALLAFLVYLLIKPIIVSIMGGLILAYIFIPLHRFVSRFIPNKNLSVSIVTLIALVVIIIPIWFITPILIKQVFELFKMSQSMDLSSIIQIMFPTANDQFLVQATATLSSLISKGSTAIIDSLVNLFVEAPIIFLNMAILGFVFFFTIRDRDKLAEFVSGLSPLNKAKEALLVKQFKDITDSLLYGQVVVGVIQGLIAGAGFLLFGIPNALVLTIIAIVLSIMPILGPFIVWAPVNIVLFASGNTEMATLYLAYNLFIVSTIDNILRPYIVSKKSDLSPLVLMIGMIGGLFVFGVFGLILGPLIIAYFLTFLKAYKDKTLSSLFASE